MKALHSQKGVALLEFALALPILLGVALFSTDLYRVHLARSQLEQSAHTLAAILSQQSQLDSEGLDALLEQVVNEDQFGDYELVVSHIYLDRHTNWDPLIRGDAEGECPVLTQDRQFSGALPEERDAEDDEDIDDLPVIYVVQLCRNSDDLSLSTALLEGKSMQAIAFSRQQVSDVTLDDTLSEELGVEDEDEE